MPPVECEILTLNLWALHGQIAAKSRWRPRLGGAVPPLVLTHSVKSHRICDLADENIRLSLEARPLIQLV